MKRSDQLHTQLTVGTLSLSNNLSSQVTHIHESNDLVDRPNLGEALVDFVRVLVHKESLYPIESMTVTQGFLDMNECLVCAMAIKESLTPSERPFDPQTRREEKLQAHADVELSPLLKDYLRQNLANLTSTISYTIVGKLDSPRSRGTCCENAGKLV